MFILILFTACGRQCIVVVVTVTITVTITVTSTITVTAAGERLEVTESGA
jgi:hypothetical protein